MEWVQKKQHKMTRRYSFRTPPSPGPYEAFAHGELVSRNQKGIKHDMTQTQHNNDCEVGENLGARDSEGSPGDRGQHLNVSMVIFKF